ncbi:hypothetical protein Rhopal_002367-T1 [Rhodotorula paludigena]|uniref:OBG-type G domain-containing protein n=1 Tax=Rhodotorula paludigena TaxID=86838 RepID=A0AAV5GIY9_9BASI|nr:hypothetical protein Rhopal_002367-T1 [Rhodotorula paludigena]
MRRLRVQHIFYMVLATSKMSGTIVDRIKQIEDEMVRPLQPFLGSFHTAPHVLRLRKALSEAVGQLKAKLAKLKRELVMPSSGGGGGGIGFDVARTGIASVGFIGFPSVGKSSLMSGLTGTESVAAAYEFTTLTTVPGTLMVHGTPLQILDLPGIIEGAKDGKGRGRQVIAVARTCQLICIVLDVLKPLKDKAVIENELEGFGIRLNKQPPNITIKKKEKGGIAITNTMPLTKITHDEIKAVLSEYRMANADVSIRCDPDVDELVDVYVLNKIDAISIEELDLLYRIPQAVPISVKDWLNIDELIETIWEKLSLVRIYTKPRGVKVPDYTAPVVLKRSHCTIEDATVWGTSVKHSRGQKVGLGHVLADEDDIDAAKLLRAFLRLTLDRIVPLTQKGVSSGSKLFGAAILTKDDKLDVVTVGTNTETESPLLHGEIQTIQQFYQIPREERPEAKDTIFFATHEPCSLCLSGITWGGWNNFYYLFTYEDTRDAFSIPHDINILEQVFRVPSVCPHESPSDLSRRALYNRSNAFFRSASCADLLALVPAGSAERDELARLVDEVRRTYDGLSGVYQEAKGEVGIPLA